MRKALRPLTIPPRSPLRAEADAPPPETSPDPALPRRTHRPAHALRVDPANMHRAVTGGRVATPQEGGQRPKRDKWNRNQGKITGQRLYLSYFPYKPSYAKNIHQAHAQCPQGHRQRILHPHHPGAAPAQTQRDIHPLPAAARRVRRPAGRSRQPAPYARTIRLHRHGQPLPLAPDGCPAPHRRRARAHRPTIRGGGDRRSLPPSGTATAT